MHRYPVESQGQKGPLRLSCVTTHPSRSSQTPESDDALHLSPESLNQWGHMLEPNQLHFNELIVMHPNI